jgi:hypothetical protein
MDGYLDVVDGLVSFFKSEEAGTKAVRKRAISTE